MPVRPAGPGGRPTARDLLAPYARFGAQRMPVLWVQASNWLIVAVVLGSPALALYVALVHRPIVVIEDLGLSLGVLTFLNSFAIIFTWGSQGRAMLRRDWAQLRTAIYGPPRPGLRLVSRRRVDYTYAVTEPRDRRFAAVALLVAIGAAFLATHAADQRVPGSSDCLRQGAVLSCSPGAGNLADEAKDQTYSLVFATLVLGSFFPSIRALARFRAEPPGPSVPSGPAPPGFGGWPPPPPPPPPPHP